MALRKSLPSGNLQGMPFLAFLSYTTLITRPQLDQKSRCNCLDDMLSNFAAYFEGNEEIEPLIKDALKKRDAARENKEPFETVPGMFEFSNEYDKALDDLQDKINVIIKRSAVFASVSNRIYSVSPEGGAGDGTAGD